MNRLRAEGLTYEQIARRKKLSGRDVLYQWLTRKAVEIDGEWVPKSEVVRREVAA